MKLYFINAIGEEAIKQFLLENHKQPEEQTTEQALSRWFGEAIDMADINDGHLVVELSADDSVRGEDIALLLDEDCYEVEEIVED